MLDNLIHFDQQLFLFLNGSESVYLDNVFLAITSTRTWIPLAAVLLYVLFRNQNWRQALIFIVCFALVILIADRFSSGVCKPLFHRFRPSHEPMLEGLVDLVNNKRGGTYGFFSSHAANMFGVVTFVGSIIRSRRLTACLLLMAILSSYSRIYLGFHYPGDILVGVLWGVVTGLCCYRLYNYLCARFIPSDQPTTHLEGTTATGFRLADINLLVATFILTILAILVAAAIPM